MTCSDLRDFCRGTFSRRWLQTLDVPLKDFVWKHCQMTCGKPVACKAHQGRGSCMLPCCNSNSSTVPTRCDAGARGIDARVLPAKQEPVAFATQSTLGAQPLHTPDTNAFEALPIFAGCASARFEPWPIADGVGVTQLCPVPLQPPGSRSRSVR